MPTFILDKTTHRTIKLNIEIVSDSGHKLKFKNNPDASEITIPQGDYLEYTPPNAQPVFIKCLIKVPKERDVKIKEIVDNSNQSHCLLDEMIHRVFLLGTDLSLERNFNIIFIRESDNVRGTHKELFLLTNPSGETIRINVTGGVKIPPNVG